jgi:O-antigen ligase
VGIATASIGVVVLIALIAAADPLERFRAFKRPPGAAVTPTDDFVRSHLLSANGSGRWQFWETAVDAFEAEPLQGQGAGSFESWWAEHGSLAMFVRDAHSLYVEQAAELGVVGLLLILGVFLTGLLIALNRLRTTDGDQARDLAACTAAFAAFAAAAAFDWMWELTVVSLVAFACLARVVGPQRQARRREKRLSIRPALIVAGLLGALSLLCLQTVPYLSELRIRASQEAAAQGDGIAAIDAADSARAIQPWAASSWLQVALVREEFGRLRSAESAIDRARANDPSDWRLWLVSARLKAKLGNVTAARASLHRARMLNPRSPLFSQR